MQHLEGCLQGDLRPGKPGKVGNCSVVVENVKEMIMRKLKNWAT